MSSMTETTTVTTTDSSPAVEQPATLEELRASHAALLAANAELRAQHAAESETHEDHLRQARALAVETYKQRVKETARDYARRHGLCSVVDDALNDLDIETTAEITFDVVLRVRMSSQTDPDKVTGSFVRDSLSVSTGYGDDVVNVELDDDWESTSMLSVEIDSVTVLDED